MPPPRRSQPSLLTLVNPWLYVQALVIFKARMVASNELHCCWIGSMCIAVESFQYYRGEYGSGFVERMRFYTTHPF